MLESCSNLQNDLPSLQVCNEKKFSGFGFHFFVGDVVWEEKYFTHVK